MRRPKIKEKLFKTILQEEERSGECEELRRRTEEKKKNTQEKEEENCHTVLSLSSREGKKGSNAMLDMHDSRVKKRQEREVANTKVVYDGLYFWTQGLEEEMVVTASGLLLFLLLFQEDLSFIFPRRGEEEDPAKVLFEAAGDRQEDVCEEPEKERRH